MDAFTTNHLNAWLDEWVGEESRNEARQHITELYLSDPDYWASKGWEAAYHASHTC